MYKLFLLPYSGYYQEQGFWQSYFYHLDYIVRIIPKCKDFKGLPVYSTYCELAWIIWRGLHIHASDELSVSLFSVSQARQAVYTFELPRSYLDS